MSYIYSLLLVVVLISLFIKVVQPKMTLTEGYEMIKENKKNKERRERAEIERPVKGKWIVSVFIIEFISIFIGLFTICWPISILRIFHFISSSVISNIFGNEYKVTPFKIFSLTVTSFIWFCVYIFCIVNIFHFKIDLFQWILGYIN